MSRQKNQSITDWEAEHARYVKEWNEWKGRKDTERRVIDWDEYEDHMLWYDDGIKHRLRLRPQWTTTDAEDLFMTPPRMKPTTRASESFEAGLGSTDPS